MREAGAGSYGAGRTTRECAQVTCPACSTVTESPEMVGELTICPNRDCLASLVIEAGEARRAKAADTTALPAYERADLVALRARYRKARVA